MLTEKQRQIVRENTLENLKPFIRKSFYDSMLSEGMIPYYLEVTDEFEENVIKEIESIVFSVIMESA